MGNNLTPVDIVKFASAYALFIKNSTGNARPKIVVGRDARISGNMVHSVVTGTLMGMGCDVDAVDAWSSEMLGSGGGAARDIFWR